MEVTLVGVTLVGVTLVGVTLFGMTLVGMTLVGVTLVSVTLTWASLVDLGTVLLLGTWVSPAGSGCCEEQNHKTPSHKEKHTLAKKKTSLVNGECK